MSDIKINFSYDGNTAFIQSQIKDKMKDALKKYASIINKKVYIFLYYLVKNIILEGKLNEKVIQKLQENLEAINKEIKDNNKHIKLEYTVPNFNNILSYIKSQNQILAGDILEGILRVYIKDNIIDLEEGDSIYFDSLHKHSMVALGDSIYFFIVFKEAPPIVDEK